MRVFGRVREVGRVGAAAVAVVAVLVGVVLVLPGRPEPGGLRVDGRWFAHADGTPLYWLADTAWDLLATPGADDYLAARADQGFTVVRTALLQAGDGRAFRGHLGALDLSEGGYWDHVDTIVDEAESRGLTLALAPIASAQVGSLLTESNARDYGSFLAARYGDASVVWLTDDDGSRPEIWSELVGGLRSGGSDAPVQSRSTRVPSESDSAGGSDGAGGGSDVSAGEADGAGRGSHSTGRGSAAGAGESDGADRESRSTGGGSAASADGADGAGSETHSAGGGSDGRADGADGTARSDRTGRGSDPTTAPTTAPTTTPTTDPAAGEAGTAPSETGAPRSRATAPGDDPDDPATGEVTGTATGSCADSAARAQARASDRESGGPVIDATPLRAGEDCGGAGTTTAHDVRAEAWRATLGGATGATYAGPTGEQGADGAELGVLRRVMESRPYRLLEPADEALGGSGLEGDARVSAAVASDGSFLVAYTPEGMDVTVDLDMLAAEAVQASWVDPRTGEVLEVPEPLEATGTAAFEAPAGTGDERDWVLVLDDAAAGYGAPGSEVLDDPGTPTTSATGTRAADTRVADSQTTPATPAPASSSTPPADPPAMEPTPDPTPEPTPEPATPPAAAPPPAADPVWDRLAACESSGDWDIATGNGYYGGLQFSQATWEDFGGTAHAPRADTATKEQQIAVATKVRDQRGGYGSWPACARKLGLPR